MITSRQLAELERQHIRPDRDPLHRDLGDCWYCRWPIHARGAPTEVHFCDWVCRAAWTVERLKEAMRRSEAVPPARREGMERYDPEMDMTK